MNFRYIFWIKDSIKIKEQTKFNSSKLLFFNQIFKKKIHNNKMLKQKINTQYKIKSLVQEFKIKV